MAAADADAVDLAGLVVPDARTGEPFDLGVAPALGVLVVIRHRYWLPCQEHLVEVRDRRATLEALGATAVAVGFSPADALAGLAEHLTWPWPFLADTERVVYARLGLRRARLREVYTAGTLRRYREAAARGVAVRPPVEDARQLGGDAVVRAGRVVRLFRPAAPDDRPAVEELLGAVAEAAR